MHLQADSCTDTRVERLHMFKHINRTAFPYTRFCSFVHALALYNRSCVHSCLCACSRTHMPMHTHTFKRRSAVRGSSCEATDEKASPHGSGAAFGAASNYLRRQAFEFKLVADWTKSDCIDFCMKYNLPMVGRITKDQEYTGETYIAKDMRDRFYP